MNKIRKFVWYYLYHLQANPEYARALMLEMRVNRNFAKTKAFEAYRPLTQKILKILEEGQEEGIIRKDVDIYIIRHLILGLLEHIVTRWLLKGEKGDLMESYEDTSKLVINGISFPRKVQRFSEISKMDKYYIFSFSGKVFKSRKEKGVLRKTLIEMG